MEPTVITEYEVEQLRSLLNQETREAGNYRNIQKQNDRTVYGFDNSVKYKSQRLIKKEESESIAVLNSFASVSLALAMLASMLVF